MKSSCEKKIFLSLAGFVPQKILSALFIDTRPRVYEALDAALFFADISGFTALTEKIATMGKEGSVFIYSSVSQLRQ